MLKGTIPSSAQPNQPTHEMEQKLRLLPKEKQAQTLAYARGLRDGYHKRLDALTSAEKSQASK